MADNVTFQPTPATPASGTVVATDELAGAVHAQYVKLMDGTSTSATPIESGNGVHGDALRVTIASDSTGQVAIAGSVAVTGTFWQATQPISAAALPLPAGASTLAEQQTQTTALGAANTSLDNIEASVASPATVLHGQKTVTAAGTEEALAGSTASKSVVVKALHANSGFVYVGANPVTSSTGFVLRPGESVALDIANLNTVYIDVSVSGEGVSYLGVA